MLHWKKIVPIVLTFCLVLSLTTTANARTALTFGTMDAGTSTYAVVRRLQRYGTITCRSIL